MNFIFPVVVIVVVVGLSIQLARVSRPKSRIRAINQMRNQACLTLPAELEAEVVTRVLSRRRATIVGEIIAIVVTAVPIYFAGNSGMYIWSGLLIVVASACGSSIGVFASEARSAFELAPAVPRIARSRTPAIGDYLSTLERWLIPASVILAIAVLVPVLVLMTLNPEDSFDHEALLGPLLSAVLLVAAIIAWAIAGAVSRHLLARGQPAGSVTELAWDDALLASSLRAVNDMPATIAFMSSFVTVFSLSSASAGNGPGSLDNTIGNLTSFGLVLILIPVLVVTFLRVSGRRPPHYLRRLWPETAAEVAASASGHGPITVRDEPGTPASNVSTPVDQAHPRGGSR
jgi:hypothetical protein